MGLLQPRFHRLLDEVLTQCSNSITAPSCDQRNPALVSTGFVDVADCDAWTCALEQVERAARPASVQAVGRSKAAVCY
jgi:hypothetical protein